MIRRSDAKKILLFFFIMVLVISRGFSQQDKQANAMLKAIKQIPPDNKVKKTLALLDLGEHYSDRSNYTSAVDCYEQSLALAQEMASDSLLAHCYRDLAVVSFHQGNAQKDSLYSFKALRLYRKLHNRLNEGIQLKDIASSYLSRGKSKEARLYYEKALTIFKQLNQQQYIASVYANLGILAGGDYRQAIEWELSAKKIWDKQPANNPLDIINVGNLGIAYFYMVRFDSLKSVKHDTLIPADSMKDLKKAGIYIKQAIKMAKQRTDVEDAAYYTEILSELNYHDGNYKDAYDNYYYYQTVTDSIYSQQNKNKIAELESRNEMDKKNRELADQKKYAQAQRRNVLLLSGFLLTLLVAGGLFYRLSVIRKQQNAQLTKLNHELDKANKTKARFFAILTHDLRSPIASLINFLHLQKRGNGLLTEQQLAEQEERITNSATSLLGVMEEILLWSKGQMENFRPEKGEVAASSLFIYLNDFFASVTNVSLEFEDPEYLIAYTDENFMRTIMQNLTQNAVNALKQTPKAKIVWRAARKGDLVTLSITDNGPGMDDEKIKKFEENTLVSSSKHGLGLQLVKDMAQVISCTISLQSDQNGTIFTVTIPPRAV